MLHVLAEKKIKNSPSISRLKKTSEQNTTKSPSAERRPRSLKDDSVEYESLDENSKNGENDDKDINNSLILRETNGDRSQDEI